MSPDLRVGVIGLGAMGSPTVAHLLETGTGVVVFDEDPRKVDDSVRLGATPAQSAGAMADEIDSILLFLPGPREVSAVAAEILERPGRLKSIIDCTTSDPMVSRHVGERLAGSGILYTDAGMLGNPPLARTGSLLLLLGATEETARPLAPLLALISRKVFHLGSTGGGHAAKLAANELFTSQVAAMAEALAVLGVLGVDHDVFLDALSATGGRGVGLADIGKTMIGEPPATGFALRLAAKDVSLLEAMADAARISLPVASALAGLFSSAAADNSDADYTQVYRHLVESQLVERQTSEDGHPQVSSAS
ncbi:NAD(P)-dependent oxidoreductase [Arthrobacter sulfonylureivorans]|uniref:NAD(P)-dependent oxidoreductase n=1 Tax=Arthrobacter sulfonylureivorans TaxID=2486855 RepID=UPI0039E43918